MTVEEALIVLLAAAAAVLLFLGLGQALDNRPPRPIRRRRPASARGRLGAATAEAGPPPAPGPERPAPASQPGGGRPASESRRAWGLAGDAGGRSATGPPAPAGPAPPVAGHPEQAEIALVEAGVTLYQAGKHSELLEAAGPYVRASEVGEGRRSHALSVLWSLTGLSRQAVGDQPGARAAFDAALEAAPEAAWQGVPPQVAALALSVGRRLIEMAERSPEGSEERVTGPRLAARWLDWRLGQAPGDRVAQALREHAREVLSTGYTELAGALIRRQDFDEARGLIRLGMDRGELPADRAEALLEVLSASLTEEFERLTSPAIRGGSDESRAVVALETAQAMLRSMLDTGMPPRQRTAMTRRLWRGYAKLGIRRLKAGSLEAAGEALFHALGMREIDARRQRQVRDALVRTLEAMAEEAGEMVTQLLDSGERPAAVEQVQRLLLHIQRAREEGLSREELNEASAKVRRLVERIDQTQPR